MLFESNCSALTDHRPRGESPSDLFAYAKNSTQVKLPSGFDPMTIVRKQRATAAFVLARHFRSVPMPRLWFLAIVELVLVWPLLQLSAASETATLSLGPLPPSNGTDALHRKPTAIGEASRGVSGAFNLFARYLVKLMSRGVTAYLREAAMAPLRVHKEDANRA